VTLWSDIRFDCILASASEDLLPLSANLSLSRIVSLNRHAVLPAHPFISLIAFHNDAK